MFKVHQNIILSNLSILVDETNLNTLVPELLNRNVFSERIIDRILNPSHNIKRQKTDLYVEILKRGPQAFAKLQDALISTNHLNLAEILKDMDPQLSPQLHRSSSLNSVSSNRSPNSSDNENVNDGPCLSLRRRNSIEISKRPHSFTQSFPTSSNCLSNGAHFQSNSEEKQSKTSDISDRPTPSSHSSENKVFNLPAYRKELLDINFRSSGVLYPEDKINYTIEQNRPVQVKPATQWQLPTYGKPHLYKMDSNPRGYALLVNNKEFDKKEEFPDRLGSENDELRMTELCKQLHFEVELHRNKTKREMEEIVENFSQKTELNDVDSVLVIFMSHGQEGDSDEDSEIIGVDGLGYKTEEIISRFYNDSCRALINKPKIFFFQACRGSLTDPGVTIGHLYLGHRIETDGKKILPQLQSVKIRTHSDIFVAYPATAGRKANRDYITGAWFIQTIVDIFSEFACNAHLEDLLKMVDERIKRVNNLHTSNFQTITTKTIGWNKNLYFNPGLCKDKITGETIYIGNANNSTELEGMDVVDSTSTNSAKNSYFRLKDDKNEDTEDDDDDKNVGCFNFHRCSTS